MQAAACRMWPLASGCAWRSVRVFVSPWYNQPTRRLTPSANDCVWPLLMCEWKMLGHGVFLCSWPPQPPFLSSFLHFGGSWRFKMCQSLCASCLILPVRWLIIISDYTLPSVSGLHMPPHLSVQSVCLLTSSYYTSVILHTSSQQLGPLKSQSAQQSYPPLSANPSQGHK